MTKRCSVVPAQLLFVKGNEGAGLDRSALTKWFYGFNSCLVLGPVIPKTLKMGVVPSLHGTQDEVGTTNHKQSAWCQYNGEIGDVRWRGKFFPAQR